MHRHGRMLSAVIAAASFTFQAEPGFPLGDWRWGIVTVLAVVSYLWFDWMEQRGVKKNERLQAELQRDVLENNERLQAELQRDIDESFHRIEDILLDEFGKKVKLRMSGRAGPPTASFDMTARDPPPPEGESPSE